MINLTRYLFSIIYSVDVPPRIKLNEYRPPNFQKNKWEVTEDAPVFIDQSKWKHRKYVTILNFQEFCDLIDHLYLYASTTPTMGSLGAPGCGLGLSPAVAFEGNDDTACQCMYVTPIPPEMYMPNPTPILTGMPDDIDVPVWEPVEKAMQEWFGDGHLSAWECARELGVNRKEEQLIS